ncbi:S24 family peptidase [Halomonas sp. I1]|uniref:XRE family transcriptional regulator n=1 Tax=Halomonas sp. I1 TaxID=393536 RepID=UPI0028DD6D6C|nr:S24 family peptidase [Halomonas sp. I1]MDT8894216.1 S24 family peptidase [Halomonas sp. I1]
MLSAHPVGNGPLVHLKGVSSLGLGSEVSDKTLEDAVHCASLYANSHIVGHAKRHLQRYEPAHNNQRMEFKDRLKAARKHAKLTQVQLAQKAGVHQSVISNLEQGKHRGSSHVVKIAEACGVRARWLASEDGEMIGQEDGGGVAQAPSEEDYALIPQLSVCGENGDGYLNHHVEVKGGLAFKRDWLERVHAKPENLRVIYAKGDSMEPYIIEGDVVLLDLSRTEPIHGKPFAIRRPDDSISIKRLMQRVTGEWILSSDNPNKALYMDEEVNDMSASQVPIIGMVIWRGGAMA